MELPTNEINVWASLGYSLWGWIGRIISYYAEWDDDGPFDWKGFRRHYDKYIIWSFWLSITFAIMGDIVWRMVRGWFNMEGVPYEERISIFLGLFAIAIMTRFDKNAKSKQ